MAVAQTTIMNALPGATPVANGSLGLTTSEKEWAFTSADRPTVLQVIADAAFLFSSQTGGSFTVIPASTPTRILIPLQGGSIFVKTATGTATAYASTGG